MADDPYTDPVTGVLLNKLGLGTAAGLEAAEREITHAALILLGESPVHPGYDLPHLCAIHRRIFGDIYDWAGQIRTAGIAKGSLFCLPQHIETSARELFERRGAEADLSLDVGAVELLAPLPRPRQQTTSPRPSGKRATAGSGGPPSACWPAEPTRTPPPATATRRPPRSLRNPAPSARTSSPGCTTVRSNGRLRPRED